MKPHLVSSLFLFAAALAPCVGFSRTTIATPVAAPAPLPPNVDVRKLLSPTEAAEWQSLTNSRGKLATALEAANRRLAAGGVRTVEMKGFESETPAQRLAKAEKSVAEATAALAAVDTKLGVLRAKIDEVLEQSTVRLPVAVRDLNAEYTVAAVKFAAAAKAAGFTHLALAGVYSRGDGGLIADAGLTDSLRTAFTASAAGLQISGTPKFKAGTLTVPAPGKTGVVVAELLPARELGGLCSVVRLVDASNFKVLASTVAIIPSSAKSGAGPSRELTLKDTRGFIARLGGGAKFSFGVEGLSLESALLRAMFAGHPVVVTNDYAFLAKALHGKEADTVSTAFWVTAESDPAGGFQLGSRPASRSTTVPVGEVRWVEPVPAKAQ